MTAGRWRLEGKRIWARVGLGCVPCRRRVGIRAGPGDVGLRAVAVFFLTSRRGIGTGSSGSCVAHVMLKSLSPYAVLGRYMCIRVGIHLTAE